jgi:hypothetical protein
LQYRVTKALVNFCQRRLARSNDLSCNNVSVNDWHAERGEQFRDR